MSDLDRRDFLRRTGGGLAALALAAEAAGAEMLLPDPLPRRARAQDAKLAIGVLGTGGRGRAALDELATVESARVVAVCDVDEGRLRGGRRRAPEAATYTEVAPFLAHEGLQAVVICTPTHLHRPAVTAALAYGLHVYCEAPLATTIGDARAIAQASADAAQEGRVCAAGFTARANPLYRRTRELYATGGLVRVLHAHVHDHRRTSWRALAPDPQLATARNWRLDPAISLGLAGERAAHGFDYLHWATGGTPERIQGLGQLLHWEDGRSTPDTVQLQAPLSGGGTWSADLTLANSWGGEQVHVHGVGGTVRAVGTNAWLFKESDAPIQGWEVYAARIEQLGAEGLVLLANATKLAAQEKLHAGVGLEHSPHWFALDDFVGSCLAGEVPACTPTDALPATVMAIAAAQAVRDGATVAIDPADWQLG